METWWSQHVFTPSPKKTSQERRGAITCIPCLSFCIHVNLKKINNRIWTSEENKIGNKFIWFRPSSSIVCQCLVADDFFLSWWLTYIMIPALYQKRDHMPSCARFYQNLANLKTWSDCRAHFLCSFILKHSHSPILSQKQNSCMVSDDVSCNRAKVIRVSLTFQQSVLDHIYMGYFLIWSVSRKTYGSKSWQFPTA